MITIKAIIPRRGLARMNLRKMEAGFQKIADDESAIHERLITNVTGRWSNAKRKARGSRLSKPRFRRTSGYAPIRLKGYFSRIDSPNKKLLYLDQGTKKKPMASVIGWKPKTSPSAPLVPLPGKTASVVAVARGAGGRIRYTSGIKPRYFFKAIVRERQKPFARKAQKELRAVLRTALRG